MALWRRSAYGRTILPGDAFTLWASTGQVLSATATSACHGLCQTAGSHKHRGRLQERSTGILLQFPLMLYRSFCIPLKKAFIDPGIVHGDSMVNFGRFCRPLTLRAGIVRHTGRS